MLLLGLGVAGFLILLFRVPPGSWDVLWAEDGRIFLTGAYAEGPGVILTPYAGYLHVVPRLIAWFISVLPIDAAAVVTTITTAALTATLAVGVFVMAEYRVRTVAVRIAIWLSFVALPIAGSELADSFCNLHWYLITAAFLALCAVPRNRGALIAQGLMVAAAVLCDPLALVLTPVIVLRLILLRERALPIAFVCAAALQLTITLLAPVLGSPRELSMAHPGLATLLDVYAGRVTVPAVFGVNLSILLARHLPWALGGLTLAALTAAVIAVAVRNGHRRFAAAGLAIGSFGFSSVVYWVQWGTLAGFGAFDFTGGTRYNTVPAWLILWAALLAADGLASAAWRHRRSGLAIGLAALIVIAIPVVADYHFSDVRAGTVDWSVQVQTARDSCRADPANSVEFAVAPSRFVGVRMSCRTLLDHP